METLFNIYKKINRFAVVLTIVLLSSLNCFAIEEKILPKYSSKSPSQTGQKQFKFSNNDIKAQAKAERKAQKQKEVLEHKKIQAELKAENDAKKAQARADKEALKAQKKQEKLQAELDKKLQEEQAKKAKAQKAKQAKKNQTKKTAKKQSTKEFKKNSAQQSVSDGALNILQQNVEQPKPKEIKTAHINYDDVMARAIDHCYDLKIADYQKLVAKASVIEARSEYLPKLYLGASTEYSKSFREDDFMMGTGAVSVGESYINPYTRFQNVLGLTLAYNLFDFGVRRQKLNIAKADVSVSELKKYKAREDLMLSVVDTYSKIEIFSKELKFQKEISDIEKQNAQMAKKLYDSGLMSKTEYNDRAAKAMIAEKKLYELTQMLQESLNWLGFYTGEEFFADYIKVSDMKRPDFDANRTIDYTKTITWKIYEKEIKKKELELSAARRAYLPKINAYGRYYLYGSDKTNYIKGINDIEPTTIAGGLSLSMPIFDGLVNHANIQKAKAELGQVQVERDKEIAQWLNRLATLRSNMMYLEKQISKNEDIVKELNEKNKNYTRLVSSKLASNMELNDTRVELLEQKIDLEKNKTTFIATVRGIEILTTDEGQNNDI